MAGGSLTITVDDWGMLPNVAQRVLCQLAVGNRSLVRTITGPNGRLALVIPEAAFPANLRMKAGGTDFLAGYVAGTNIFANIGNAGSNWLQASITQGVACSDDTNRAIINSVVLNVGGNPRAITLNYANAVGLGTVNIYWGDGTSTLGAAESNAAAAHTYPDVGTYEIRIYDASAPVDATSARTVIKLTG
jgi:hypothetical protein